MNAFAAILQASDWQAAGHVATGSWREWLAIGGPALFALVVVGALLRAMLQRMRYRAVDVLTERDLADLEQFVGATERTTSGEIVTVVVESSDAHPAARWRAALVFLVAGSLAFMEQLPWNVPSLALAGQLALGLCGYGLARWIPGFARLFVDEARATEMAEEQALQEFQRNDLHRTAAANGVLIFVSLFERRVVVLGDRGIHEKVGDEHWTAVDRAVLDGVVRGKLAEGLREAIRRCGEVLAQHFPHQADDRDELSNRIVVRRS